MLSETTNIKFSIDTEKLDKILENRDVTKSTYIIMSVETSKAMKDSKVSGANYPYDCKYWKGCTVLFDNNLLFGEIKVFQ